MRFAERVRRWAGRVIGQMDMIRNLETAGSLGSRAAMRRLREIEADASQPGVVRTAAQAAWRRARSIRYLYDMGPADADDAD